MLETTDSEVITILFTVRRLAQKQQAKQRAEEEELNYTAAQDKSEEEKLQE
jgi:hypothetical protein